jgi:hypothetical protein
MQNWRDMLKKKGVSDTIMAKFSGDAANYRRNTYRALQRAEDIERQFGCN